MLNPIDERGERDKRDEVCLPQWFASKSQQEIELGVFVKMAKLLPEWLVTTYADNDAKLKPKKQSFLVLEWLHCYPIYIVVVEKEQSECIADLMGYQPLVIEVFIEYKDDCWIG